VDKYTPSHIYGNSGLYSTVRLYSLAADCIKSLGIKIPLDKVHFETYHMSTKMGIHAYALYSSLTEVQSSTMEVLLPHIRICGGDLLYNKIVQLRSILSSFTGTISAKALMLVPDWIVKGNDLSKWSTKADNALTEIFLRRLSTVTAPGGKTRIIAIVDYFTQCSLRRLHLYLINN